MSLGLKPYGPPTLADQAILDCPSFKMGPGDSSRSHTADEFIKLSELRRAVPKYMKLLDGLNIIETKSLVPTRIEGASVTNCKNHLNTPQKRRK